MSLLLLVSLVAFAAGQSATDTIATNLAAIPELSSLNSLLRTPAYAAVFNALNDPAATITLFAPSNDAISAATFLNTTDVPTTTNLLLYHTLDNVLALNASTAALAFPETQLAGLPYVNLGTGVNQVLGVYSVAGSFRLSFGIPTVSSANVTTANIVSSNGLIHIIDAMENFPKSTSATAVAADLSILVSALQSASLVSAVDDTPALTIFAPTDAAFEDLGVDLSKISVSALTKILLYHVVPGVYRSVDLTEGASYDTLLSGQALVYSGGAIEGASIAVADALTVNAVVHVINNVLLPESVVFTLAETLALDPDLLILNAIVTDPAYSAIYNALNASTANNTLFAPNDNAFLALGITATNYPSTLANTLLYHVIPAFIQSSDLPVASSVFAATLLSASQYVNLGPGENQVVGVSSASAVYWGIPGLDESAIVGVDGFASNGVYHKVATVFGFPNSTSNTASAAGLDTLVSALQATGLVSTIDTTAGITIFAPTDLAFTDLPAGLATSAVGKILAYHVVPGIYRSTDLTNGQVLQTLLPGQNISIDTINGYVYGENTLAELVLTDVLTVNAVVHVINEVLIPSLSVFSIAECLPFTEQSVLNSIVSDPAYAAVFSALNGTAPLTLFAPSDAAFAALGINSTNYPATLTNTLLYHVISGAAASTDLDAIQFPQTFLSNSTYVNLGAGINQVVGIYAGNGAVSLNWNIPSDGATNAAVIQADIPASNGYIHVLDKVLGFPNSTSNTAVTAGLSSLVAALSAANLVGAVDSTANITVFAPSNAAFAAAGVGSLPQSVQNKVLLYHVVQGVYRSTDLANGAVLRTLLGETLTFSSTSGVKIVGSQSTANITLVDSLTVNAVVHVIDAVLLPSSSVYTVAENIALNPDLETLNTVINLPSQTAVLALLNGTTALTLFAPSDAAFAAANIDTSNASLVTNVLQYHVLSGGAVPSSALGPLQFPATYLSAAAYVNFGTGASQVLSVAKTNDGAVTVNWGIPGVATSTANVIDADIGSTNGFIHVIDRVEGFPQSTSATAAAAGLSSLVNALVAANLVTAVDGTANITIFAPTNAAFLSVPEGLSESALTKVLLYHVVVGLYRSTDLATPRTLPTLLTGQSVFVNLSAAQAVSGSQSSAAIVVANALTINAVVHVIDTVLVPASTAFTVAEYLAFVPSLSTLNTVVQLPAYQPIFDALNSASASQTLFGPNDAAFAAANVNVSNTALVTNVLQYHVLGARVPSSALAAAQFPSTLLSSADYVNLGAGVNQVLGVYKSGSSVTVNWGIPGVTSNTASVVIADVQTSNGVIHVIDKVEGFPATTSATAQAAGLTQLVAALVKTGLVNFVDSTPGLTIFAPTDAAFNATGGVDALSNSTLTKILSYHVIPAIARSVDLTNGETLTTALGQSLTVNISTAGVQIKGAKSSATVVVANALTKNAVVHVIDTVLLPASSAAFLLTPSVFLSALLSMIVLRFA